MFLSEYGVEKTNRMPNIPFAKLSDTAITIKDISVIYYQDELKNITQIGVVYSFFYLTNWCRALKYNFTHGFVLGGEKIISEKKN